MKILALTVAPLFAASPVAAQTSQTQQPLGANGQRNNSTLTNTGVICQEEMVATFCNHAYPPTAGAWSFWHARTTVKVVQGSAGRLSLR
jgi:hypothetical protein